MFNFIFKIERWKYNKTYQVWVSTEGRFRNKSKADLSIKIGTGGYCYVKVDCASCQYMLAHRLVMLTWRPTPDAENLTVDHLDHNKRNNALSNLEWITREENQERAINDFIEVISKETFDKLVEAEVQKHIKATSQFTLPPTYENDAVICVGEDRTAMPLGTFIDAIWDRLDTKYKIKNGTTKSQIHATMKRKIEVNRKSRS